jgi:hypothetical protein
MGNTGSRRITDDPFPIDEGISRDLDKLSMAAIRILSTSDIYDINNLARPGVCGDYAVFLRDTIAKKLLPFVADISGGKPVDIVYQNPRKAMDKPEIRKEVCTQLATTMIRTMAVVVAALASMQVARPSRDYAASMQRGGAVSEVIDWLAAKGYIASIAGVDLTGQQIEMLGRGSGKIKYYLKFHATVDGMYPASLTATGGEPPMPAGGLKITFAKPVTVPGTDRTFLPIRVSDNAGIPWMVGILFDNVFQSLAAPTTPASVVGGYNPYNLWEALFRKTQGFAGELHEPRAKINEANEVFNAFKRIRSPQPLLSALSRFLTENVPGYIGYAAPAPVAPYGYPAAAAGIIPGAAPTYGYPPVPAAYPQAPGPIAPRAIPLRPAAALDYAGAQYDIPTAAAKSITGALKLFKDALPKQSSPAAVRVYTLASKINPDRTIQLGVCRDPYWTEPNLSKVYPWATFQFLSVETWEGLRDKSTTKFYPEWRSFISELAALYSGGADRPKLTRLSESAFLDQLKMTDVEKMTICEASERQRVSRPDLIRASIDRIQALYKDHVKAMWAILNSLIVVIVDPEKKTEVVRLHPNVVSGPSRRYVEDIATKTRDLLAKFYIAVEREYLAVLSELTRQVKT